MVTKLNPYLPPILPVIYSATLFSTISSIARFIGRAPKFKSKPANAIFSISSSVISSVIFLSSKVVQQILAKAILPQVGLVIEKEVKIKQYY